MDLVPIDLHAMVRQELIGHFDDPLITEPVIGMDHLVIADGLLPAADRSEVGVSGNVVLILIPGPVGSQEGL